MSATLSSGTEQTDVRRINRIPINLPIKVECKDSSEAKWSGITRLDDVSAFGAAFTLPRPIKRGRLIYLTLPMPRQMRCYDHMESQYQIWAIIRRCRLIETDGKSVEYDIGVAFLGKHPPSSYFQNPTNIYELKPLKGEGLWDVVNAPSRPDDSDLPIEDRRHSRHPIPVNLKIELLDENGESVKVETTVTENVSLSGASVFTSMDIEIGNFVKITSEQDNFSIKAVVRGKRIGPDGIPRIHIEFIDNYFPLKGIDA